MNIKHKVKFKNKERGNFVFIKYWLLLCFKLFDWILKPKLGLIRLMGKKQLGGYHRRCFVRF